MIELQINPDQASILCDALTEWSRNHREYSGYFSPAQHLRHLDEATVAEALRDTVRVLAKLEVA